MRHAPFAALIALTLLGRAAIAQDPLSRPEEQQMLRACQNTVDEVKKRLSPHLDSQYGFKENLDGTILIVPVADFNAFADYQNRRVLLSFGWCTQTFLMTQATVALYFDPSLRQKFLRYMSYLNRRQKEASKQAIDMIGVKSFYLFASLPPPNLSDEERRKHAWLLEQMMIDGTAFVLAHEIGHLALNHKSYSEISDAQARAQEFQADRFAVRLLKQSDFMIIPAILTLQRFMQATEEDPKGANAGRKTHPRAECRMERVVFSSNEITELLKNPTLRAEFEKSSGYSVPQFRKLMRELKEDCDANP